MYSIAPQKFKSLLVLLTLVLFTLTIPASAGALTVLSDNPVWQTLEQKSKVPTPGGNIRVVDAACPAQEYRDKAVGCFYSGTNPIIYIVPNQDEDEARTTFYHESGHLFDNLHMSDADRKAFAAIVGVDPNVAWKDPEYELNEKFAVAYAVAAEYGIKDYKAMYPSVKKPKKIKNKKKYRRLLKEYRAQRAEYMDFKTQGVAWEHDYKATPQTNAKVYHLLYNIASR